MRLTKLATNKRDPPPDLLVSSVIEKVGFELGKRIHKIDGQGLGAGTPGLGVIPKIRSATANSGVSL